MRLLRWSLVGLLLLALLMPLLALQRGPSLPAPSAGGEAQLAQQALQARRLWRELRPGAPGVLRRTQIGETELNGLLAQVSRAQGEGWRARASIEAERLSLRAALPAPGLPAWLNLQLAWDLQSPRAGALPPLQSARVGGLPLPAAWVEAWLQHRLAASLPLPALLSMLEGWKASPGRLQLEWRWRPEQAPALMAAVWTPAEREALLLQARLARQAPPPGLALAPLLQGRAQAALQAGGEQAAALRGLLVVAGLQALGRDLAPWLPEAGAQGRLPPLPLQLAGREDMAMHFLVAALLSWQGGERAAAALGLAKELADRRGGSGFSFNDLAADAAGNRFGRLAATQPEALLQRLAGGLQEADFFPEVADLPEYLSERGFRARYGELGSPAYVAEMARIQARVAQLPLYQGKNGS